MSKIDPDCPLPNSDAWKKELVEWLNNKISACEINKTIDHDLGLPNSKELVCHVMDMVIGPLKELKQKIQEM